MNYTPPESVSNSREQLCARSENVNVSRESSYTGSWPEILLEDCSIRDIPELQRLHEQMTADNLRLWECLNAVRCNRRTRGIDVLYELFSLTDKEFFRSYPAYLALEESGSGALRHLEGSCGAHSEQYLQHLVMHTNRLILENSRLYACIEVLSSDPSHMPDEVVCHIFALSEDEFARRYPSIGVGNHICRHLANLHEETRGRKYRSVSLPFRSPRRIFRTHAGSSLSCFPSGPSCSSDNSDYNTSSVKGSCNFLPSRALSSSRRSWPYTLGSVPNGDKLEHRGRHQNGGHLSEAPKSPRPSVTHEFSSRGNQRSNTKFPSPQRRSTLSSGRNFTYQAGAHSRLVTQSLARQPAQARTQLRCRSMSPDGRNNAKSNNAVVYDDSEVDHDNYRKDGVRFQDHDEADDSDDYDDGIAYKRKNRRVLSSSSSSSSLLRSRDLGAWRLRSDRLLDDLKSDLERHSSRDPTSERYWSVAGQDIAPGWSSRHTYSQARKQEQDIFGRASGFERIHQRSVTAPNVNTSRKDSLMLVRERGDRPASPGWRGSGIYSREARARTCESDIQNKRGSEAECRLGVTKTRNEHSISQCTEFLGSKVHASDTRMKYGSLQQREKTSVEKMNAKSSHGEKANLGSSKPLVIRHEFSPTAGEDSKRLSTGDDCSKSSAREKETSPTEGAGSGLSPGKLEESRHQLLALRTVLRQHSSFTPKREYVSRRLLSDSLRSDDQGHLGLERAPTNYDVSSRLKSKTDRGSDERPALTSRSRPKSCAGRKTSLPIRRTSKSPSEQAPRWRHSPTCGEDPSRGQEAVGRKPSDWLDSDRCGDFALPASEASNRLAMNNNAYARPAQDNYSSPVEDDWNFLRSGGVASSKWRPLHGTSADKDCTKVADDSDERDENRGKILPSSAATIPTLVDSLPTSANDLRKEIDKTRSFLKKRAAKPEKALQSLYENLGEVPAQPAKRNFAANKIRASTDSPRRRLDFEEEARSALLLNSSQNQSVNDVSKGPATPPLGLGAPPSSLQPQDKKDTGSKGAPACVLGEVAFQLERRIIQMVFGEESSKRASKSLVEKDDPNSYMGQRHRFYGYTVSSMPEKIRAECRRQNKGIRDGVKEADLKFKLRSVLLELRDFGYSMNKHSTLAQDVINKYGLFSQPPDSATIARLGLHDFRCMQDHVVDLAEPEEREDMLVLLNCLHTLARKVGKPVLCFD